MPDPDLDSLILLKVLSEHNVDFIVVGGMGAVLQGAALATFDLDIVHSRAPENLNRLVSALRVLKAYYREHHDPALQPEAGPLAGPGHHLLMTEGGPVDVLGELVGARDYEALLADALELDIEPGVTVRVLSLPMLIKLKEELGREKDLAVIAILRQALSESQK
jgi:hypothetical protein